MSDFITVRCAALVSGVLLAMACSPAKDPAGNSSVDMDAGAGDGAGGSGGASAQEMDGSAAPGTDGSADGSAEEMRDAGDGGRDAGAAVDVCDTDNGGCDPLVTCNSRGGVVDCGPCPIGFDDANADGTDCQPVDCGVPKSPSNGSVATANGTTYGEEATYDCSNGHVVAGGATRTCEADGHWSGSAPTCVDFDACSGSPACAADYPCQDLPAPSLHYTCRGQFADWTPVDSPTTLMDNGDGTVSDSRSGLAWQQTLDASSYNEANAKVYCDGLVYAVHDDWRLPTRAELESIVDFGTSGPAIDAVVFPGAPTAVFWTSSPSAGAIDNTWYVDFGPGYAGVSNVASTYRVRCVRGGAPVVAASGAGVAPPGRYSVAGGTVSDTFTGLTWQQAVDAGTHSQGDAVTHCAALALAGGGWRLPVVSELLTILNPTQQNPALDASAFPSTPAEVFWSASPYAAQGGWAWFVSFADGSSEGASTTDTYRVRCVR
jgi:hypothetical protein